MMGAGKISGIYLQNGAIFDDLEVVACADLLVGGDVNQNPMEVALAWFEPITATGTEGAAVAILRGYADSPGCVAMVEPPLTEVRAGVVDGNLHTDPMEINNLYYTGRHQEVIKRLTARIHAWQKKVGDQQKV